MEKQLDSSKMGMVRRIVTANVNGRSVIQEDGFSPHIMLVPGLVNHPVTDVWRTTSSPADPCLGDVCSVPVQLSPPKNGTVFRVVEFPPEKDWQENSDTRVAFASMGKNAGRALQADEPDHPLMHRTDTVDYAVVLRGEIWAVLDEGEALMRAGDVLVQRSTNHSWANRSDSPCVMAFVLVDAS